MTSGTRYTAALVVALCSSSALAQTPPSPEHIPATAPAAAPAPAPHPAEPPIHIEVIQPLAPPGAAAPAPVAAAPAEPTPPTPPPAAAPVPVPKPLLAPLDLKFWARIDLAFRGANGDYGIGYGGNTPPHFGGSIASTYGAFTAGVGAELGVDPSAGWGQLSTTNLGPANPNCTLQNLPAEAGCRITTTDGAALSFNRGLWGWGEYAFETAPGDPGYLKVMLGRQEAIINNIQPYVGEFGLGGAAPGSVYQLIYGGTPMLWIPYAATLGSRLTAGPVEWTTQFQMSMRVQDDSNAGDLYAVRTTGQLKLGDWNVVASAAYETRFLDTGNTELYNGLLSGKYSIPGFGWVGALVYHQHQQIGSPTENPLTAVDTTTNMAGVAVSPGVWSFLAGGGIHEARYSYADSRFLMAGVRWRPVSLMMPYVFFSRHLNDAGTTVNVDGQTRSTGARVAPLFLPAPADLGKDVNAISVGAVFYLDASGRIGD